MTKWLAPVLRRIGPVLGAGVLLQASSCDVNTRDLAAGLIGSIAQTLIQSFVFGAFNLTP